MADGMDEIIALTIGPGKVFVDGDYIGDCPGFVATRQEWPEIVVEDSLEADEIG